MKTYNFTINVQVHAVDEEQAQQIAREVTSAIHDGHGWVVDHAQADKVEEA